MFIESCENNAELYAMDSASTITQSYISMAHI